MYCWITWWRSINPRQLFRDTADSLDGRGVRVTITPRLVTLKNLKRAAEETMSAVKDQETWLWLRRVEAAGLQVVEAQLVSSQLKPKNLLGEGTYGKVFQIQLADVDYPICLKLAKGLRAREYNLSECEVLASLQDIKGVPRVLGISLQPDAFIMTMHGHYTLLKCARLRSWLPSEKTLLRALQDLSSVLADIHKRGLCHNDIKLNNVMLEMENNRRFTVTLIDFGLMSRHGSYPFKYVHGNTKPFYDPELMRRQKPCSEATDMYSMGYLIQVILFCLPTSEKRLWDLCALAMGPDYRRPSFSQLVDTFKNLAK